MNIQAHRALIREINAQRRIKHYVEYMTEQKKPRAAGPPNLFGALMAAIHEPKEEGENNGSLQ
jgi:hypothetical protein